MIKKIEFPNVESIPRSLSSIACARRMSCLIVTAFVICLGGCQSDPILRADNERNFRASWSRMEAHLSSERIASLDEALRQIISYRDRLRTFEGFERLGSLQWDAHSQSLNDPFRDWPARRAELTVERLGPLVDRLTVGQIVALNSRYRMRVLVRHNELASRIAFMEWTFTLEPTRPRAGERLGKALESVGKIKLGDVMELTTGVSRRFLAFTIQNDHEAPLKAVVLGTRSEFEDASLREGSLEYVFLTPLPSGARRRQVVVAGFDVAVERVAIVGALLMDGQRLGQGPEPPVNPLVNSGNREENFWRMVTFGPSLLR